MKSVVLLIFAMSLLLSSCGKSVAIDIRDGRGGKDGGGKGEKPGPGEVKKVESIQLLNLQKPTTDPALYSNVMSLEFDSSDQAWFSFLYTPKGAGSLFFTVAQTQLTLDCANSGPRSFARDVVWQEVLKDGTRKVLKRFVGSITEYEFQASKTYILSYVLENLKKDFSDCKKATLKFAAFPKNY
ncbi:MAG: hypothetical protein IPM97_02885 [Bdellovibrionaceae bacterium]|nr:hypothetical protein [Pseudobdellovibrionaceae bacterium]